MAVKMERVRRGWCHNWHLLHLQHIALLSVLIDFMVECCTEIKHDLIVLSAGKLTRVSVTRYK